MGRLVLKRRADDEVYIYTPDGQIIKIMVTQTNPNWTKLGIDAPEDFVIYRKETVLDNERAGTIPARPRKREKPTATGRSIQI